MKDLFSTNSKDYARFRPGYPPEVFVLLRELVDRRQKAWDCGTGNGQLAGELSHFFQQVHATDISVQQLAQAVQKQNIHYTKQAAEKTVFPDNYFDLVTVAQAVHWFEFDAFYAEVRRVLKPGAPIAILGYALIRSNPETNEIIDHFYRNIVGKYWDPERRYLEENYQTIPFPFPEIRTPTFEIKAKWSFERFIGYLNTWSAVKHYEKKEGENPLRLIIPGLQQTFGELREVVFPVLLRVGINDLSS